MTADKIPAFLDCFKTLSEGAFIRLVLSAPKSKEADLVRVTIRPVLLKAGLRFAFTYRHRTRDIVKNFDLGESLLEINTLLRNDFKNAVLFSTLFDLSYPSMKKTKPTLKSEERSHDRSKKRHVETNGKPYLTALGITDTNGAVLKSAQDKYRQIDKYIEILSGLFQDLPSVGDVVDMGSGKGYLTFALADYLQNAARRAALVKGIEYRKDLVDLCNSIAQQNGFDRLSFEQGTIADYTGKPDVLIALHACDTATDDAIFKGIEGGARLIVVAPCCHKQVRKDMRDGHDALHPILRHGIFQERQAEMLTDAIRALILERHGYKVKVFEFISGEHTAKNVMITAVKTGQNKGRDIKSDIAALKQLYGLKRHYLEELTDAQSRQ